MKNTIIFFVIVILIIVGLVSCSSKDKAGEEEQAQAKTTTEAPLIKKKPVTRDTRTDSYDFCENLGHEVIIRFDKETENSKIYCRFSDTTECEADEFVKGNCSQGSGSITHETSSGQQSAVICAQSYNPVCGKNGITYSNDCIASLSSVEIKHTGVCIEEIQAMEDLKEAELTNNTRTVNEDKPDWLSLAIDMTKTDSVKTPSSYINKCAYVGEVVFYEFNGNNSPDTLYDKDGGVICYPNKDLGGECPNYFNSQSNCKRIWTDDR